MTQETVADLERARKEFEATIQRKEKDASGLMAKLDDEQSLVAKVQKSIKESQARVEEMEEELEAERQSRAKVNSDLSSFDQFHFYRPRGRDLILQGSSKTSATDLVRRAELLRHRLNSTKSVRLKLQNYGINSTFSSLSICFPSFYLADVIWRRHISSRQINTILFCQLKPFVEFQTLFCKGVYPCQPEEEEPGCHFRDD